MSAAPTRAHSLGVKPAQMRRGSVSRINKAKASLVEVIGIWADIDEGIANALDVDGLVQAKGLTGRLATGAGDLRRHDLQFAVQRAIGPFRHREADVAQGHQNFAHPFNPS